MEVTMEKILETTSYIEKKINGLPDIAVILGSGLGGFAEKMDNKIEIGYKDIPNFPVSTVKGHEGKLIIGNIGEKKVIAMNGRLHYYEGYTMQEVTFPIRVFKKLGINHLIIISAVGGINNSLNAGDIVIVKDYIKLTDDSPLIGRNLDEFGERFPNMNTDNSWIERAKRVFEKNQLKPKEAVYAFMAGPQYETKAEVNMLKLLGADVVGMSTVPEIIVAKHSNMKVSTFGCVTNALSDGEKLSHKEVLEVANKNKEKLTNVLLDYIKEI